VKRSGQVVQLCNRATGEVLLARLRWCSSFACRLRGLTWRASLPPGEGLVLDERADSRTATAIHMLFVFFPIAVLWLDSTGRVVDTRLALPWRPAYVPRAPARYIVEALPTLLSKAAIGDELDFVS
jgi:uncharacterized membrane protein (UPF0127 family)